MSVAHLLWRVRLPSTMQLTSLKLSGTRLGDDAGSLLENLRDMCREGGPLHHLDLSSIGLTDRGARKLFEAMMSGEYPALTSLALGSNDLKDPKGNGLIEMLRMDDCALTSLDLSDNPLSGSIVMRALKLNKSLTYLNVRRPSPSPPRGATPCHARGHPLKSRSPISLSAHPTQSITLTPASRPVTPRVCRCAAPSWTTRAHALSARCSSPPTARARSRTSRATTLPCRAARRSSRSAGRPSRLLRSLSSSASSD